MGLVRPATGRVMLGAERIDGKPPEHVARLGVGLVPQGRRMFSGLTVAENLALGALRRDARNSGVHWDLPRVFEIFPRLRDRMQLKADRLSGGEQQSVAVERARSGNVRMVLVVHPIEV